MYPYTLGHCQQRQQLRNQQHCTVSNRGRRVPELYIAIHKAGQRRERNRPDSMGEPMSVSRDRHTASTDDHSTSTHCHHDPNSGDDYGYSSGADRNNDGHCDCADADNDCDILDDNSDSEPGSQLSGSQ